ncbi:MAG: hypothetical protein VB108_01115 [Anaerolineaceae bacterium]|nr:hypothetical protein [Anaerolineaceae bacterium]
MADPILKKISDLTELNTVDMADFVPIVDVSETNSAIKTKRIKAENLKLFNANQLSDGIVTNSKLASGSVAGDKIANESVTTIKLAPGAVTEDKLSGQKRALIVKLFGSAEEISVVNFPSEFYWPEILNGWRIVAIRAMLTAPSTSGAVSVIVFKAPSGSVGTANIAQGATVSSSISASTVMTSDVAISLSVSAAGTGAKGLAVEITAQQV